MQKGQSVNLSQFSAAQLAEMRGQARMNVAMLERLGARRTVQQAHDLADQRALLRRLTREVKAVIVQQRLF